MQTIWGAVEHFLKIGQQQTQRNSLILKGQCHEMFDFLMDIHEKSIVPRSTEILNLKDSML
jgi:hypothetical protein